MMEKRRIGGAAIFVLGAVCMLAAHPALAFESSDRCFMEPVPAPSNRERIREIDRLMHNPSLPTQSQACLLFARGLLHHFDGDPQAAIDDFSRAVGWMRDPEVVYEMRGDAYEDAGQHDKAVADYAEAEKAKPDAKEFANLCWVRAVRGHPLDRALADCNAALKEKADNTNAREARCFVQFRSGRYADAISDCDAVLKDKPHSAAALYVRGLAKQHRGDTAGGAKDIAAASDLKKNIAPFFALWGVKQ
jgi:tetratricopeptide (TPR) repeat protein